MSSEDIAVDTKWDVTQDDVTQDDALDLNDSLSNYSSEYDSIYDSATDCSPIPNELYFLSMSIL